MFTCIITNDSKCDEAPESMPGNKKYRPFKTITYCVSLDWRGLKSLLKKNYCIAFHEVSIKPSCVHWHHTDFMWYTVHKILSECFCMTLVSCTKSSMCRTDGALWLGQHMVCAIGLYYDSSVGIKIDLFIDIAPYGWKIWYAINCEELHRDELILLGQMGFDWLKSFVRRGQRDSLASAVLHQPTCSCCHVRSSRPSLSPSLLTPPPPTCVSSHHCPHGHDQPRRLAYVHVSMCLSLWGVIDFSSWWNWIWFKR